MFQEQIWLNEKLVLAENDAYKKAESFEDKIKALKKHQALENEVDAGKERFGALQQVSLPSDEAARDVYVYNIGTWK